MHVAVTAYFKETAKSKFFEQEKTEQDRGGNSHEIKRYRFNSTGYQG